MIVNNDIYMKVTPTSAEEVAITTTGVPGVIYNGIPDWLYQEEVLSRHEVMWPSADGTQLLFASFNDSKVNSLEFPWFGNAPGPDPSGSGTFPPRRSIRYPTPGSSNPEVDLWIAQLNTQDFAKIKLKPPPVFEGQ